MMTADSVHQLRLRAPLTDRAARLCRDGAFIESMELCDGEYIGAEHIFLAIVKDNNSLPAKVLHELGVLDQVIEEIRLWIAAAEVASNKTTGSTQGYLVEAEDGEVIVVDEHGSPVSPDDQHRQPKPLWYDGDDAVWYFRGTIREWGRRLSPGRLRYYMVGPDLAKWDKFNAKGETE